MQHVELVIPTRGRIQKLRRCLSSIPVRDWLSISVVCDGDPDTFQALSSEKRKDLTCFMTRQRMGSVYCRNLIISRAKDGVLYATDDLTFEEGSIDHALSTFNKEFSNEDGVVGFVQSPESFHPTGVALVGKKFIDRYPHRCLFYPKYFHFSCQEVYEFSKWLGRFRQDAQAKIIHYHPQYFVHELDQTHHEARSKKKEDFDLRRYRKSKGLLWGRDRVL